MELKTLRQLREEANDELPTPSTGNATTTSDDSGPPVHPAAKNSDNPLLEADYDDPVDSDEVDTKVTELADAVAGAMDDWGSPEWKKSTAYKMLVDDIRDAIVKHASPARGTR